MANSDTLTCKPNDEALSSDVEEFVARGGYESRNQALEDLIRTGLRESKYPILTRLRERVIHYSAMLCVFALVFIAGGVVTEPIHFANALLMAIVLVAMAVGLIAVVELARLIRGTSELGSAVHGWLA